MIYDPAEDSFLLKKVLEKEVKKANSSLEIGVGSGYLSEYLDAISKKFVGVDINPEAVKETKKRVKGMVLQSDLFSKVPKNRYDIIIFNPPYLPKHRADREEALATVGGKHGYEVIIRFIQELSDFLLVKGSCYLLFSSLSKPEIIFQCLEQHLFDYEKVAETSIMMEQLFVYKITPNKMLQNLISKKITNIRFLSRGKRSIVMKGVYNNIAVAIKILRDDTDAILTIDNESKNLQFVNTLNIGPKYISKGKNYVIMEFIDGVPFRKYWEHASKKELHKVISEIINQCYILDTAKFQKMEMIRPYKHVIIGKKITFIDFERGKLVSDPINITQFLQFLHRSQFASFVRKKFSIDFKPEDIITLAKQYKCSYNIKPIQKYILQKFN